MGDVRLCLWGCLLTLAGILVDRVFTRCNASSGAGGPWRRGRGWLSAVVRAASGRPCPLRPIRCAAERPAAATLRPLVWQAIRAVYVTIAARRGAHGGYR